jgi:hypothetical protein
VDKSSYADLLVTTVTGGKLRNVARDHAVHINLSQVLLKAAGVVGFTESVIYSAATADWPR